MKNKTIPALVICLVFSVIAVNGQKKEERTVSDFNAVSMGIHGTLYLEQGSPRKVVVESSESVLEKLETEVKNGILRIKFDTWKGFSNKDVTIWITMPEVHGLYLSGSGKILAENAIKTDEIELKISGSGKLTIDNLRAEEVESAISGSGDMTLAGTAEEMEISISGSGDVYAEAFTVSECEVRISGSGGTKINATEELNARISGSGSVYYFENPLIDASVSGSGKIKKGNN